MFFVYFELIEIYEPLYINSMVKKGSSSNLWSDLKTFEKKIRLTEAYWGLLRLNEAYLGLLSPFYLASKDHN